MEFAFLAFLHFQNIFNKMLNGSNKFGFFTTVGLSDLYLA